MDNLLDGFWQIEYDDPQDSFVEAAGADTNISLRRSGFTAYAGGHFVHIRADSGRIPPSRWPPSQSDKVQIFRTATGAAGTCAWTKPADRWVGQHAVEMSPDPRDCGTQFICDATVDGDEAEVDTGMSDGRTITERWRRLSGPGSTYLAGAWQSIDADQRWLMIATAGHYAVVRQGLNRPHPATRGELTGDDIVGIFDSHGSNAGAVVVTATSFDNHPFVATNAPGYDATKHPSFFARPVGADRLEIGFEDDGSDAGTWTRIG